MIFTYGEPITLLSNGAATTDDYGDPVPALTSTVVRGAFDPGGSVENESQDTATTQPVVYLPPGTDASWVDAVEVRGITYQVDGSPNEYTSPFTGASFGVQVRLKTVLAEPR